MAASHPSWKVFPELSRFSHRPRKPESGLIKEKGNQMRRILQLLAVLVLLATTGCIVPVDEGGHRHWEHWDHDRGYWDHHHDWDDHR
jgi:hypothetical protein